MRHVGFSWFFTGRHSYLEWYVNPIRQRRASLAVAQLAVDVQLFRDELRQHLLVPTPVGLGDLRTQFALTTLQA